MSISCSLEFELARRSWGTQCENYVTRCPAKGSCRIGNTALRRAEGPLCKGVCLRPAPLIYRFSATRSCTKSS